MLEWFSVFYTLFAIILLCNDKFVMVENCTQW